MSHNISEATMAKGDVVTVVCDDDTLFVHEGERHEIAEVQGTMVRLVGVNGWFARERFQNTKEGGR